MGMYSICKIGPVDTSVPHRGHDLFTEVSTLYDSYGLVTLDQVIQVADVLYEGTTAEQLIEIENDKWSYTCLFHSRDEELQTNLSLSTDITNRMGLVAFKFLIGKVTDADSEAIRATELE